MEHVRSSPQVNPLGLVRVIFKWGVLFFPIHRHLSHQLKDIANGLDYLHTSGLVHGDLRAVCLIRLRDNTTYSSMARRNISL